MSSVDLTKQMPLAITALDLDLPDNIHDLLLEIDQVAEQVETTQGWIDALASRPAWERETGEWWTTRQTAIHECDRLNARLDEVSRVALGWLWRHYQDTVERALASTLPPPDEVVSHVQMTEMWLGVRLPDGVGVSEPLFPAYSLLRRTLDIATLDRTCGLGAIIDELDALLEQGGGVNGRHPTSPHTSGASTRPRIPTIDDLLEED